MTDEWRLRLPALVAWSRYKLMYLVYWTPFIALYQLSNRWPIFTPHQLPLTQLDRLVPFVPELLPIYVGYIPLYWWTVARLENDREVNRIFYAAHFQLLMSLPFFVLFPVSMPRDLFYQPETYNWADAFWRWFDAQNNCFPSLHVSNCLLLLQFTWARRCRVLHAAACAAVIASTVLVKQHYVVDVAGGAAVYLVSRRFLHNLEVTGLTSDGWRAPAMRFWRPASDAAGRVEGS